MSSSITEWIKSELDHSIPSITVRMRIDAKAETWKTPAFAGNDWGRIPLAQPKVFHSRMKLSVHGTRARGRPECGQFCQILPKSVGIISVKQVQALTNPEMKLHA